MVSQALDALTTQLDEIEFSALLVIQSFRPDAFFSLEQQLGGDRIVHELYRLGFAGVCEWSKPQPTGRINEIMRVLTRYVLVE